MRPAAPRIAPLSRADATHLLRRLCLAAPTAEVERFAGSSPTDAVEALFEDARTSRASDDIALLLPTGELAYLQAWWCERMLADAGARCAESVALMWHDHFATSHDKVRDVHLMHGQYRLWRERGLGDFRALLHAALVDPALLVWLDGVDNERGRPNENLARELLELFALGIGNYTERDVLEAARGLSGWRVVRRTARFTPSRHDAGSKTVLGVTGALDTPGVVDAVLAHDACPRFVAGRLWEHLMARTPSEREVTEAAEQLVANDWDTGRTLAWLATRERFFATDERAARIAIPIEFVVRATLETGVRLAPKQLADGAAAMGQALMRPPSVKGWDGGRRWIDSTAWIARQRFAARVAEALEGTAPAFADLLSDLLPEHAAPAWRAEVERLAAAADEPARVRTAAVLASAEYHLS